MHDSVATECRAELGRGQGLRARQLSRSLGKLFPAACSAVPSAKQQRGSPMSHRVANPVEPGNGQTGPSGKPERVDTAPSQQILQPIREIGRH